MIAEIQYRVRVKIKTHCSPLYTRIYEMVGVFLKETASYYIFDGFKVRKQNVVEIQEVI